MNFCLKYNPTSIAIILREGNFLSKREKEKVSKTDRSAGK